MINYINIIESNDDIPRKLKAKFLYFKAYYYRISQNDSLSFIFHNEANKEAIKTKDTLTILNALTGLAQSYNYIDNQPYRLDYLDELKEKADLYKNDSYKIVATFLTGNYYLFRENDLKAIENYRATLNNKFSKRDSTILINTLSNIGVLYSEDLKIPDSALFYLTKRLDIINNNKAFQSTNNYFNTYLNIGTAYNYKNMLDKAEYYYSLADSVPIAENILTRKSIIKQNLADIYSKQGNFEDAYKNYKQYHAYTDSINRSASAESIAKYENQELKIQNLESETKRIQNRNLLFGAIALILFGSITFYLIQKNTRRKQKLAEQEKILESQKLATVLKEQELMAIDAMIEGQEKERQRIANDLHDDLGGLMANVKLHFNALKDKGSNELYDKTGQLIDNAYHKVRSVAHAKNSGVIAKDGLLKSVQHMADKVSKSNQLQIDVVDHGLEQRLENSLELTLFRIIQELTTNIIKHADASEATIHLTQHEDSLNIMVEDNGKGFNPSQVTKKKAGMGISSIDKRVAHLEGNMTIESELKKGTTIIIDIPV